MSGYWESPELVAAETLRDQTAGQEYEDSIRDWSDEEETGTYEDWTIEDD